MTVLTADMAIQNVIGDSFASHRFIHNGGGVGWGEVINGGLVWFLMVQKNQNV
jgi:urocanate hydratase